jgi:hypothetical protein
MDGHAIRRTGYLRQQTESLQAQQQHLVQPPRPAIHPGAGDAHAHREDAGMKGTLTVT